MNSLFFRSTKTLYKKPFLIHTINDYTFISIKAMGDEVNHIKRFIGDDPERVVISKPSEMYFEVQDENLLNELREVEMAFPTFLFHYTIKENGTKLLHSFETNVDSKLVEKNIAIKKFPFEFTPIEPKTDNSNKKYDSEFEDFDWNDLW